MTSPIHHHVDGRVDHQRGDLLVRLVVAEGQLDRPLVSRTTIGSLATPSWLPSRTTTR